jgi:hypothetical protein
MTKAERKRREKERKKAEAAKRAKLLVESRRIASPQPGTVTPRTQSSHKNEANNHAEQTANDKPARKSGSEGRRMSGAILAISGLLSCIFFAIAAIYWGKGSLPNVKTGFFWLIPFGVAFSVAVLSAYWYYVVQPESRKEVAGNESTKERPFVFFKYAALEEPLTAGKAPAVTVIVANSGSMEAEVRIWDASSYFELPSGDPPPVYSKTDEEVFSLAPTAEANGRIMFPTLHLTEDEIKRIVEGKARFYCFARGEYKDELGRIWKLPFCRMYAPDFPGNMINCPKGFKIEDANNPTDQPHVWIQGLHLLNLSPGQVPIIEVIFENTGPVPAYNFLHDTTVYPTKKPLTEAPPYVKASTPPSKAVIPNDRTIVQRIPGAPMDAAAIEMLRQGRALLYVYGTATYDDGRSSNSTNHTLKFCGYYFPATDTFRSCPFHNSSD